MAKKKSDVTAVPDSVVEAVASTDYAYTVDRDALLAGLKLVVPLVSPRSTLPVLSNVFLEFRDGIFRVAAADLSAYIYAPVARIIDGADGPPMAITLPARLLTDLVNLMTGDMVSFQLDERTMTATVACGRNVSHIKGIGAETFPAVPDPADYEQGETLPVDSAIALFGDLTYAAASESGQRGFDGILSTVQLSPGLSQATNGHALAWNDGDGVGVNLSVPSAIVPLFKAAYADRLAATVDVFRSEKHGILFRDDTGTILSTAVPGGTMPDTASLRRLRFGSRMLFDTKEMIRAVRLCGKEPKAVQLNARGTICQVQGFYRNNPELDETLSAKVEVVFLGDGGLPLVGEGPTISVALGAEPFLGMLSAVKGQATLQHGSDPGAPHPIKLRAHESGDETNHLLMPLSPRKKAE